MRQQRSSVLFAVSHTYTYIEIEYNTPGTLGIILSESKNLKVLFNIINRQCNFEIHAWLWCAQCPNTCTISAQGICSDKSEARVPSTYETATWRVNLRSSFLPRRFLGPFQYLIKRLIIRSGQVLESQKRCIECSIRYVVLQTHR